MLFFSVIGGVIGLACGIIAIILGNKVRKNGPNGLATAGFVCGIVGTVLCALMVVACTCLFGTAVNVSTACHIRLSIIKVISE